MAINCYTGLQGSGKSYETVASVIVPSLKNGRRIITNIAGLDEDAIKDFLEDERVRREDIREIIHFAYEDILKPGFFCRTDEKTHEHTPGSHVNAGDLVIVDEVWRFWGSGEKLRPEHLEFFRMHRHYTDLAGVSCDMAIITQDVGDLDRKLKAVIETTFQMVKLKNLGRPKNYRIEIYSRANTRRKPQQVLVRKYDPKIFALYSSYDGKGGQEKVIDGRQNMLKGAFFRIVLPLMVVVGGFGACAVTKAFDPKRYNAGGVSLSTNQNKTPGGVPGASINSVKAENAQKATQYRIVGVMHNSTVSAPVFTVERRDGALVKTIILASVSKWSLDETGYTISYKGNEITESDYEARESQFVNRAPGSNGEAQIPFSPP